MRVTVRGRSMLPTLHDGDEVDIRLDSVPRVGEIALYLDDNRTAVLHRVLAIANDEVLLQGDACPRPDALIARSRILGVVVQVQRRAWMARRRAALEAVRNVLRRIPGMKRVAAAVRTR